MRLPTSDCYNEGCTVLDVVFTYGIINCRVHHVLVAQGYTIKRNHGI